MSLNPVARYKVAGNVTANLLPPWVFILVETGFEATTYILLIG